MRIRSPLVKFRFTRSNRSRMAFATPIPFAGIGVVTGGMLAGFGVGLMTGNPAAGLLSGAGVGVFTVSVFGAL